MSRTAEITIAAEDPRQPGVAAMVAELDQLMTSLYPAESNHLLDLESLAAPEVTFLVARQAGRVVGTGAICRHDRGLGEIKRMYVDPRARGLGIGRRLLAAIEDAGARQGLNKLALETGIHQPEAIGLYRAAGFQECPPFASYRPDPLSLFMVKEIGRDAVKV
jgi:putative acetyltransferase